MTKTLARVPHITVVRLLGAETHGEQLINGDRRSVLSITVYMRQLSACVLHHFSGSRFQRTRSAKELGL